MPDDAAIVDEGKEKLLKQRELIAREIDALEARLEGLDIALRIIDPSYRDAVAGGEG